MNHFDIIQSLCRIGLASSDNPAFRHQVERLRSALEEESDRKGATALARLLKSTDGRLDMRPSCLARSKIDLPGERLTAQVAAPVDRETGASLAQVEFPTQDRYPFPVLHDALSTSVNSLLEEWAHLNELAAVGVAPARTCLFFGHPGTGKTHLALAIAARLQLPIVVARLDGLVSSFLGTTARNIGSLFNFANRYRCILLLDEFDALAKVRDDPQEIGEIKRVVNAVLQNLDQRSTVGLTIAITNHQDLLDVAVWRRFEIRIQVPKPGFDERQEILKQYLPPFPFNEIVLRFLSWITDGFTGADIEVLTNAVKRYSALRNRKQLGLLDTVAFHLLTQAGKLNHSERLLLLNDRHALARALVQDQTLGLTQQQVSTLFSKDQATISRWLKEGRNSELVEVS
jgi:MoxR-like ATPase